MDLYFFFRIYFITRYFIKREQSFVSDRTDTHLIARFHIEYINVGFTIIYVGELHHLSIVNNRTYH